MSTTYTSTQALTVLKALGFFPKNRAVTTGMLTQAVRTFQGGYNLGAWLKQDGGIGPLTSAALAKSEVARRAGRGTASANFSFSEFRCTCGGYFNGCRVILVRRELLQSLEKYRARTDVGTVHIRSGYRCPTRNSAVGGAKNSQHMYGVAVDLDYAVSYQKIAGMRIVAGIGKSVRTGKARHLDRRDVGGHNLTNSSLTRPQIWNYPQ